MVSFLCASVWTLVVLSVLAVHISEVVVISCATLAGHSMKALSMMEGHLGKSLVGELSFRIVAWSISFIGSGVVRYVPFHADRSAIPRWWQKYTGTRCPV
eukprot:3484776-Pyramimonas_sp.AAC.1